jgi:hypothetical protein
MSISYSPAAAAAGCSHVDSLRCVLALPILYAGVVFSVFLTEQHSEAFRVSAELAHGCHPSSKVCTQCHVLHAFCV